MCGGAVRSGPIQEPLEIHTSSLPVDDRGWHELILRVYKSGERFCYRTSISGTETAQSPVLRVHAGDRFAVRIVNELDGPASGATIAASALPHCGPMPMPQMAPQLSLGYMNHTIRSQPMPPMADNDVNMHFHGFEGAASQENVFLSSLSTREHACEFELTIPQTQPPGTYFYHPHAHGMADDEVGGGLSGMWIVDPNVPQIAASDEHVVVLNYRIPFLNDNAFLPDSNALYALAGPHQRSLKAAAPVSFDPFNPLPWPSSIPVRAASEALVGMCGNRSGVGLAVDGVDAPGTLDVPSGEQQLLRILNATTDSIVNLKMRDGSGRDRPMQIVGRDGVPVNGDFAQPLAQFISKNEVTLVPAARVDVLVALKAGESLTFYGGSGCTAPLDEFKIAHDILSVHGGPPGANVPGVVSMPISENRTPAAQLVQYVRAHAGTIRRRAITYSEYLLPKPNRKGFRSAYFITETSDPNFHEHEYSPVYKNGASAPTPDIVVKRGTIEEWSLYNATMETHSFHIHQMSFVAENDGGAASTVDTIGIPFGSTLANPKDPNYPLVKPSRTRVLLDFRNVPRGTFLFHCHMLFHEDRGMMAVIRVE